MFPEHRCGLHLTHNQHKDYYETVEQYLTNSWMKDISEEEKKELIDADEIWELQWYPDTPVGFYKVVSPTFEGVLKKANDVPKNEP